MTDLTGLIGTRVILNTGPGCQYRYRAGVIESESAADLGASGRHPSFVVLLDKLPREKTEKRRAVALVVGNELVRDCQTTREKIAGWLREHEPSAEALLWL